MVTTQTHVPQGGFSLAGRPRFTPSVTEQLLKGTEQT